MPLKLCLAFLLLSACASEPYPEFLWVDDDPLAEVEDERAKVAARAAAYREDRYGAYVLVGEPLSPQRPSPAFGELFVLRHGIFIVGPIEARGQVSMQVGVWTLEAGGRFGHGMMKLDGFGRISLQRPVDPRNQAFAQQSVGTLEISGGYAAGHQYTLRGNVRTVRQGGLIDRYVALSSDARTAAAIYLPSRNEYRQKDYWVDQSVRHLVARGEEFTSAGVALRSEGQDAAARGAFADAQAKWTAADRLRPTAETAILVALAAWRAGDVEVARDYVQKTQGRSPSDFIEGQLDVLREAIDEAGAP